MKLIGYILSDVLRTYLVLIVFIHSIEAWWPFKAQKKCFGSLGCFTVDPPFNNTRGALPRSQYDIGTSFLLYTRNFTDKPQELVLTDNVKKCSWKTFCRKLDIKVIIHGYMDSGEKLWVKRMVKALLKQGDFNVIVVDWREGAKEINYYQSAANIRVVGAQVAQLLKVLEKKYQINPTHIHIIGHSLGAHAAGYVGEYLEGIGRITGLDPAGPAFENTEITVRLDPSDAIFVDVIHTDGEPLSALGFGIGRPVGTVDFFPNGGKDQPGCPSSYFAQMSLIFTGNFELVNNFACSHLRALQLFTESINSKCKFVAYPCNITKAHSGVTCDKCTSGCAVMGYHVDTNMPSGQYYLPTNPRTPFCKSRKKKHHRDEM